MYKMKNKSIITEFCAYNISQLTKVEKNLVLIRTLKYDYFINIHSYKTLYTSIITGLKY